MATGPSLSESFLRARGAFAGRNHSDLASVFARTQHRLSIAEIAIVAAIAAVTGDNIGFAAGRYDGRPLLDHYRHMFHIEDATVRKGESLFTRHEGMAVDTHTRSAQMGNTVDVNENEYAIRPSNRNSLPFASS